MKQFSIGFDASPAIFPVAPDNLRTAWLTFRPHVDRLAELAGEKWIAEDVFHELLIGNAHLWAFADLSGFIVFRVFATSYTRDLFIWLCWKENDDAAAASLFPQILEIARSNDCRRVTFDSPREGFIRALPGAKRMFTYAIDVEG